jgi:hypothetical protein
MITTIILVGAASLGIILLIPTIIKSIKQKEWGQLSWQIIMIMQALMVISFVLQVYFTIN